MIKPIKGIAAACLFMFMLSPTHTKATNLMGSDLTWTNIGQDSFLVKLTVYRDCNGSVLNTAILNFHCATTGNLITSSGIPVPSAVDITPVSNSDGYCSGTNSTIDSRCSNPNSSFPYGIEKYEYISLVVLSSAASCCKINISYYACCRSASITTGMAGQGFYNCATLNRCIKDNSPEFTNPPVSIICVGQDFTFNHAVIDRDTDSSGGLCDSLVYEWAYPKGNNGADLSYSGLYDFNKPLFFWGFPNANLAKPKGFHLNPKTGDIAFRPLKIEQTLMSIKVSEYRQGIKIGELRRDLQFIVISCPANNSPILSGPFYKEVCATDTVSFSISTNDFDVNDTLKLSWSGNIPDASWIDYNCISKHPTATFFWIPGEEMASSNPYLFTVSVEDNSYPLSGKSTKAFQIIVRTKPKATLTVSDSNCGAYFFHADPKAGKNPSYLWSGNFIQEFQDSCQSVHHKFSSPGLFPYSLKISAGGCDRTYTDTIKVDTFLIIQDLPDVKICAGDSLELTALYNYNTGPVNFQWSTNQTAASIKIRVDKDSTIRIQITDSMQCMVEDSIHIKMRNIPQIKMDDVFICEDGFDYLFPSLHFDESELQEIKWRLIPDSSIISYDSSLLVNKNGLYVCEVTDTSSCVNVDTVEVSKNPIVSAYVSDKEICSGDEITLIAMTTGSKTSNVSYAWYSDSLLLAKSKNLSVSPQTSKEYKLHVSELLNGVYCEDSVYVKVLVKPLPHLTVSPIDTNCIRGANSQSKLLNNYVSASPVNTLLDWSSLSRGLSNSDSGYIFIPANSNPGEQWMFVTATDPNTNCAVTDSLSIHVYPLPEVNAGLDDELCSTDSLYEVKALSAGVQGIWTSKDRVLLDDTNAIWYFDPMLVGNRSEKDFEFYYTVTDDKGCENMDTLILTVYKTPESDAGLQQDVCLNANSFALNGYPANGKWTGTGVVADSFYPALAGAGEFMLEYEVENHICSAKDQTSIRVKPLPGISVSTNPDRKEFCQTEGFVELVGLPSGGIWTGSGVDSNYFNSEAKDLGTGYFDLRYTYKDTNGCSNSDVITLQVNAPPELNINQDNQLLCLPDTFHAKLSYQNADQIEWYTKPPSSSGFLVSNPKLDSVSYLASVEDVKRGYFILYARSLHDKKTCNPVYDSVVVSISDYPRVDFDMDQTQGCTPLAVQFTNKSTSINDPIIEWKWEIDTLYNPGYANPYFSFTEAGKYSIGLSVTNLSGCKSHLKKTDLIRVFENPKADFQADPLYAEITDPIIEFENKSTKTTQYTSFHWDFGDQESLSKNTSGIRNPEHSFSDTGKYKVTLVAINEHQCRDTVTDFIEILPVTTVYAPNAFTPDHRGPEINNTFRFTVLYGDAFDLKIYSRWGELLYESNDYETHGWDGTYLNSSREAPLGTYIYVLYVRSKTGKNYSNTGTISLLK